MGVGSLSTNQPFAGTAVIPVTLSDGTTTVTVNYRAVGGGTTTFQAATVTVVVY